MGPIWATHILANPHGWDPSGQPTYWLTHMEPMWNLVALPIYRRVRWVVSLLLCACPCMSVPSTLFLEVPWVGM